MAVRQEYAQFAEERRRQERQRAYEESLAEDCGREFFLPIGHRPTENLVTDNLEQASVDTHLSSSNPGFRLLQKMGWKGKGLGKDEQGITEPIRVDVRDAKLGVGKQEQDNFHTAAENIHRKRLEVEQESTEESMKRREVEAEREQKVQTEVKQIQKVFFCDLCNKQYKLAVEFETHLSSYDHNHKKRFKDMKELHASRSKDERQKREQAQEERELARFARIQQQLLLEKESQNKSAPSAMASVPVPAAVNGQEQRTSLKFGFGTKSGASKLAFGSAMKKQKVKAKISTVFQNDSDEDS